jgi:hypothetical protein
MYFENADELWTLTQCLPDGDEHNPLHRLMNCGVSNSFIGKGDKITIRRTDNGPLKIFEVEPIGKWKEV